MFSKTAYAHLLATIVALATVLVVIIAPSDFWASDIDPVGSSFFQLARSPMFYIGPTDVEGQLSSETLAWRVLANSQNADSLFRRLFLRGTSPARLYALIGLHESNPRQYQLLKTRLVTDTTHLDFWTPCEKGYGVPLEQLMTDSRIAAWAAFLKNWEPSSQDAVKACAV
jgi:hypothetical protein